MKVSVEPPVGRFFGHVASRPICERLERLDGVGEGEEPPGASGHRRDRATRGGRRGWEEEAAACLREG